MSNSNQKTILLGLDGATWKQIDKFVSKIKTPNLHFLMENSSRGILESHVPFSSNACWLSILTGTNPGKHGIPHHSVGGSLEVPLLWNILSDNKLKQIIVNDMVNYPPLEIDGVMITGGFSTPFNSKDFVSPKSFLDEINTITKDYKPMLSPHATDKIRDGHPEEFFEELQKWGEDVVKISTHFSQKIDWDILSTFIENTDYINHFFWDDTAFLERFYQWLDTVIGNFLKLAQDTNANLFIVSDHGGGPIHKHFLINSWLQSEGFTEFQKPNTIRKILSKTKFRRKLIRQSLDKFHLRGIASQIIPKNIKKSIPIEKNETGFVEKDSKVYSESYNEIIIKTKDPKEYDQLRNDIIKKLLALRDSDGKKVVLQAFKREEVFSGPFVNRAHDIQFILNEGYSFSPVLRDQYIVTPKELGVFRKGDHRPEGIFMAYGPNIKKNFQIPPIYLYDVTPTILHSMGYEIPSYMDGRIVDEIFDKDSLLPKHKISIKNTSEKDFIKRKINIKKLKI